MNWVKTLKEYLSRPAPPTPNFPTWNDLPNDRKVVVWNKLSLGEKKMVIENPEKYFIFADLESKGSEDVSLDDFEKELENFKRYYSDEVDNA